MWRKALGADGRRIIDIRATENPGEVAKYVTKPGGYLELTGEQWQCDDQVLETLHDGLASRRMITWCRSLSPDRKQLGFLHTEDQSEDLVDVGDDDDDLEWKVLKILTYRWSHNKEWRSAYRLRYICLLASEGGDDG
jgi:hypothetical protein